MKYTVAIIILAAGLGYFAKVAWNKASENKAEKVQSQMEQSLFPFILAAQPKDAVFARPMRTEETRTTVTVYCEYLGDKSTEAREDLRKQLTAHVQNWANTQNKQYDYIFIKFTDEVLSPIPPAGDQTQ